MHSIDLTIPAEYAAKLHPLHPNGAESAAVAALRLYLDLGEDGIAALSAAAKAAGVKPAEHIKTLLQPAPATPATTITPAPRPAPRKSNAARDAAIVAEYRTGTTTYAKLAAKHNLSTIRVTQIITAARERDLLNQPTPTI